MHPLLVFRVFFLDLNLILNKHIFQFGFSPEDLQESIL